MAIYPCCFSFLLVSLFVSFCYAEIRLTEIRHDDRPIIPFDEFGFTHTGRLELNVSNIALSNQNPDLDMSKVGFFLCTRDAWMQVLLQIEDGYINCALNSDFVKLVFEFKQLKGKSNSFNTVYQENTADQYTLVFANCLSHVKVSMDVRSAMYNLDGKEKHRDYLSAGKTILPRDKEKNVLMVVIPLQVVANVAQIVIDETGPFGHDWMVWKQVFLLVDVVCCCAVLFPIVWSIKNLREAAKTDGKAAVNLMKLTLFRQYYIVVICYIYFTRVVVYALVTITSYKYLWTSVVAGEMATLAFYVFTGYKFKPEPHNPYFVIDDEEEEAAAEQLKLEDEFEL
ncbi:hypothetical protein GOBAR_DD19088 [Gossypium barbadense]|nr:hypothetical protein GOBAR_DD19088 [Gossypium barbadense]